VSHRRLGGFSSLLSARLALGATVILFIAAREAPGAQWPDYRDPRIPRTKAGKANPTAPAPRVNGKPDLSGLWQAERTPLSEYASVLENDFTALQIDMYDITNNLLNVFWGIKPEEDL